MATERTRQLVLGALVVALALILYRMWPGTSAEPASPSNRSGAAAARPRSPAPSGQTAKGATGQTVGTDTPGVHLDALNAEWPKPGGADRNLFRFQPKAPPPPPPAPPRPAQPAQPVMPVPTGPPPPPPLAPITLKFIGIIDSPTSGRKIAVLSDGRNPPFQGVEGDIIEGRYRILKIGVESVELAYADGRGRQTIRLTGS